MRIKLRAALGALALVAVMSPVLAASPAQAATCSNSMRVDKPARSLNEGYGRVYIKDGATSCYNKRIVVYIQIKANGVWSSLLSGKHYLPTDSDGTDITMKSIPRPIACNATVRSAFQLYRNAAGTGGSTTVTGTESRLAC